MNNTEVERRSSEKKTRNQHPSTPTGPTSPRFWKD
jgi:hypothetical protein